MSEVVDLQRVTNVIDWLIFKQVAVNRRDLAGKMGYTESSFSQILNGKVPLSGKFIKKLAKIDGGISEDWLMTGEGEMLRDGGPKPEMSNISIPREVWEVIQNQAASLSTKDQQVSKVISLLEEQLKKGGVRAGENSAVAM